MRLSFSIPLFNLPKSNPKMTVYGAKELEADLTLTVTVVVRLGGWLTVMRFGGLEVSMRFGGNPGDVTELSGHNLPVSAQTGLLTRVDIYITLGRRLSRWLELHPTSRKVEK